MSRPVSCAARRLLVGLGLLVPLLGLAAPGDRPGEPVRFAGRPTRLQSNTNGWWAVAVSPDGRLLATTHGGGGNNGGEVWVWDREAGKVVRTLPEPSGVRVAAFSPDGKTLITGNFDNAIRCYDTSDWSLWAAAYDVTGGHAKGVNGLAFRADGRYFASAGLDNTARLWDFAAIRKARAPDAPIRFGPVAVFEGHTSGAFSVALAPDGKTLVTGSGDNTARLWDIPADLPREWGKPVVVKTQRAVLREHTQPVEAVAISPDGRTFATGSWDGRVRLWDANGRLRATLAKYDTPVLSLAFNKTGDRLAVGTGKPGNAGPGRVHVVAAAKGWAAPYTSKPLGAEPAGGPVYSVAFLPDGQTVAFTSRDRALRLQKVGDAGAGRVLRNDLSELQANQVLLAAALSPDGRRLVVGGESKLALVWDIAEKRVLFTLAGHTDEVTAAAYSPDGKHVATAGHDKTVRLWDAATGRELRTLRGHTNWVFALAFAPDGRTLASGGYDRSVRLWGVETGEAQATWHDHTAAVRALAYTPDGRSLLSAGSDRIIRVWDVAGGQVRAKLKGHRGVIRSVAVSPDGRTAASGADDKTVRVWNLADGREKFPAVRVSDLATVVRFSPRGRVLLAGTYSGDITNINPATGVVRGSFGGYTGPQPARPVQFGATPSNPSHGAAVTGLLFAPGGEQVYSVSQDKNIFLWKSAAPPAAARVVFRGHGEPVTMLALSPDGKLLATGDKSGESRLWDAATGKLLRELPRHPGGVSSLAFLGNERLLTAGADGVLRVCAVKTGQPARVLKPGHAVTCAAVSPGGKFVAVACAGRSEIILYDAETGDEARRLGGHTGAVKALAFSPDGATLLSGAADGQVIVWDAAAGRERKKYAAKAVRTGVDALAFAPDGKTVAAVLNYPGTPPANDAPGEQAVHEVALFDPAAGPTPQTPGSSTFYFNGTVGAAQFTPDGKQLVVAQDNGKIAFWDVERKRSTRTIDAHAEAVNALAVASDGDTLYSAGDDYLAKRWAAPISASFVLQARLFVKRGQVWAAFFSPDGKLFATAGDDAVVRLRGTAPGTEPVRVRGDFPSVYSVALSPDDSLLASGHYKGPVRLTDAKTGKLVRQLGSPPQQAWAVAFSPDGKRLAAAGGAWQEGSAGWVAVWDAASGKELFSAEPPATVFGVAYSPDGKQVAGGGRDGKVRVWDAKNWKLLRTLDHGGAVRDVTYSPDGKLLVSGGYDGRAVFWSARTGERQSERKLGDNKRVNRVRFARDGTRYLITYNEVDGNGRQTGRVEVWRSGGTEPERTIQDFGGMVLDAAFHPDGRTLVTVGGRQSQFAEFRFYDVATGAKLFAAPLHRSWIEAVCFNNDGSRVISAGGVSEWPGEIHIRATAGLRPARALAGHPKAVQTGTFSPDGKRIATGGQDGTIIIWDAARAGDAAIRRRLKGCPTGVRQVLFSPDGRRLFAAGEDGTVQVWDAAGGELAKSIRTHNLPVYGLALSPDGKLLATCAGDWKAKSHGEISLWNAETLEQVARLPRQDAPVWSAAFSRDGKQLYTAGGGLDVWDVATRKKLRRVAANQSIRCVVVSPDGRFVAAGTQVRPAGRVLVFETATWQEVASLGDHQKLILGMTYSPNGLLATASGDGSVILWRNQPDPAPKRTADNRAVPRPIPVK